MTCITALHSTKAMLLDVDGTLYRQTPVRLRMALELLEHYLAKRSPLELVRVMRNIACFRRTRERLRALGRPNSDLNELQYAEPAKELGIDTGTLQETIVEWMVERPLPHLARARRGGITRLLGLLADRDVRIGAFSDYPVVDKLKALNLHDYFSVTLCSTDPEINAFKPHPAGFLRACEIWNLDPSDVVYIGDRTEVDGAGARAAGLPCLILGATKGADGYCGFQSFDELSDAIINHK